MTVFLLICLAIGAVVFIFGGLMAYAAGMADSHVGDSGGCSLAVVGLFIAAASGLALLGRWLV